MPQPRLENAVITACSLEIPLEDFAHLPQELGCSLHRSATSLTLASDQPGCALHFKIVDGGMARLDKVEVTKDPEGRFFRDVVGLVLQVYSGDLEAELTWSPKGAMADWVEIRSGETTHPLLYQPDSTWEKQPQEHPLEPPFDPEYSLPRIEQWLDEAEAAWEEYLRLKGSGKPSPEA